MSDEIYETIRLHMNSIWPLKLPKHKKVLELFKILWPTEEEAEIIATFREPITDPRGPRRLAKLTGIPLEKVIELCEKMTERGVIGKLGKKYTLLPPAPGIMDFYFISKSDPKETLEKVAKLWLEIEDSGFENELGCSDYPLLRAIPASSLPQKITRDVEINESLPIEHEILVFEDVVEYIKSAKSIRVVNCVCRTYNALAGNPKCDKPVDICIYLNEGAELAKALNRGKEVTLEEALKLLKTAEDYGLVHSITNSSNPAAGNMICNCCPCHCSILGALLRYDNPRAFAKSNFRPEFNNSTCKKCEKCVKICPARALWRHWPHESDASDDFIALKEHRCIGCGLCAHHCPTNSISMKKVFHNVPADSLVGILHEAEESKHH